VLAAQRRADPLALLAGVADAADEGPRVVLEPREREVIPRIGRAEIAAGVVALVLQDDEVPGEPVHDLRPIGVSPGRRDEERGESLDSVMVGALRMQWTPGGGGGGSYYVDRGPAYIATSLRLICADLGIHLLHAGVQDAEAKGVIERWHRTWREEVGDELPDTPLPLAELNAKHWAWLGAEYHVRGHDTTRRAPREHLLAEAQEIRSVPHSTDLDEVFLHREERVVRKDGTVRFRGGFLEVRADLGRKLVELRFDPADETALPRVFLDGRFVCGTVPLDRLKTMTRKRRRIAGDPAPFASPSDLDPLGLIEDEHYRRTRPAGAGFHDNDEDDEEQ